MTDERENKYSASAIECLSLCPGKGHAERGLPETLSDDSKAGDLIHAALAGGLVSFDKLDSDQLSIYDELTAKASRVEQEVFPDGNYERGYELRLWNLSRDFSAKVDRASIRRESGIALLQDFKTGRNEVAESSSNLQLRTQAVCAAAELKCHTVYVAIVQIGHKPTICKYELPDLTRAELEILGIIHEAEKDNAPRMPGEKQCRYCRARFQCPERLATADDLQMQVLQNPSLPAILPEELSGYLDQVPAIERICDDLKAEAKRRLTAGEDVPGWKLAQGKPREAIADLPTVHARASELGVTTQQFTAACSLTKKAAKEILQAATGSKGKKLEEELAALISGCTKEGEMPQPSLERI